MVYSGRMLRRYIIIASICAFLASAGQSYAEEYHRSNGEVIKGVPIQFDETGVVFRKDAGGYTDKLQWPGFTQESLKLLAQDKNPRAAYFASPFIEVPLDLHVKEVKPPPAISVGSVDRLNCYFPKPALLKAWITPAGLLILIALYIGNLFAAYSVARFRRKQPALVCGVSAVLPVLGPVIFLTQPETVVEEEEPEIVEEEKTEEVKPVAATDSNTGANSFARSIARAASAKGTGTPGLVPVVFEKGKVTFNHRFLEGKFPTFFRPVLGPKEQTLKFVITISGGKTLEVMKFSKVTVTDLYVLPLDGSAEVQIPMSQLEIVELKNR